MSIIIILILILSFPFVSVFTIHQFIEHPDHWKKILIFLKGAKYLGDDGMILQNRNDCGLVSLKIIFDHFKIPVTLDEISQKVLGGKGSSMRSLKEMAKLKGLRVEGWRLAFKDLKKIDLPAIAFVSGNHYVVISEVTKDGKVIVLDPAIGKLEYLLLSFWIIWKGEVLIFKDRQSFSNKPTNKLKKGSS